MCLAFVSLINLEGTALLVPHAAFPANECMAAASLGYLPCSTPPTPTCSGASGACVTRSAGESKPRQRRRRRPPPPPRLPALQGQPSLRRAPLPLLPLLVLVLLHLQRQQRRRRQLPVLLTWTLAACWPPSRRMCGRRCCSGEGR